MIGDRMDTDIQAGAEAGLGTILVLSGVARRRRSESLPPSNRHESWTRLPI